MEVVADDAKFGYSSKKSPTRKVGSRHEVRTLSIKESISGTISDA